MYRCCSGYGLVVWASWTNPLTGGALQQIVQLLTISRYYHVIYYVIFIISQTVWPSSSACRVFLWTTIIIDKVDQEFVSFKSETLTPVTPPPPSKMNLDNYEKHERGQWFSMASHFCRFQRKNAWYDSCRTRAVHCYYGIFCSNYKFLTLFNLIICFNSSWNYCPTSCDGDVIIVFLHASHVFL